MLRSICDYTPTVTESCGVFDVFETSSLQLENKNNPINTITSISLEKKIVLSLQIKHQPLLLSVLYVFIYCLNQTNNLKRNFLAFTGKFPDISRIKPRSQPLLFHLKDFFVNFNNSIEILQVYFTFKR
jgi:hypothetical protein